MLVDISHALNSNVFPFPDDPKFTISQLASIETDGFSNYLISTGMHIGTHVDGAAHMVDNCPNISELSLAQFYGEAVLLDYSNKDGFSKERWMESIDLKDKIVLLSSGHDCNWGKSTYFETFPKITMELAQWFVNKGVKMVGMDTPSPDEAPYEVHKLLLSNGVLLLENITNLQILSGYTKLTLMAFPLKIEADSSLVRAVVLAEY